MVQFNENIIWTSGQEVTVDLLQFMSFNDIWLNQFLLECKTQNVNPSNLTIRNNKWIVNNAALFARELKISPGADLQYDGDGYPKFKKTYNFPGNNFWDSNYLPIVTVTPQGNRALPQTIVVSNVTPEKFDYTVWVLKAMNLDSAREFWVDVLAVGIKPVQDNDLDGDGDPSP